MTKHIGLVMGSLAALALFAGCNGSQSYAPATVGVTTGQSRPEPLTLPSLNTDSESPLLEQVPDAKSYCRIQNVKMPGQITVLASAGEVKKGEFVSSANHDDSIWARFEIEKSTAPTPTPAPSSAPLRPYYLYYGTFTLKNGNSGCALLLTSQDGKPLVKTSRFNTVLAAAPAIRTDYTISLIGEGFSRIKTGKLTRTGGSGSIVLTAGSPPRIYTTGTIKFTGRAAFK
jgi:hypothetical protein